MVHNLVGGRGLRHFWTMSITKQIFYSEVFPIFPAPRVAPHHPLESMPQHQQPPRLPAWPQPAAPTRFVLPDPAQASASQQIQHPALPAELKPTISYVTDSI